ncbi:MAG TPA: ribosome maturation factor RimM [Caulobacteraceae bacterium]
MSGPDRLVLVARVAGAFGVRGEVRIRTYTDGPLAVLNFRQLSRADGSPGLTLASGRAFKDGLIARAQEISTKEEADALKGVDLYAPRSALPAPDADEFYLADLIGLAAQAPDGAPLGVIKAVLNFGAADVLEIQPPGRDPSWMVAFTAETAPAIDIAGGRVVVVRPAETE